MENEKLQTMEEALANVPEELELWLFNIWNAIVKKKIRNLKYIKDLGEIPQKTKEAVKKFYGKNVSRQVIKPEDLRHIYERHGKNIKRELADGQILVTAKIAALIPDILSNPDSVEESSLTGKDGHETIAVSKEYADGTVHVVEAVLKNNILEVWTAYVWSKEKTIKKRLAGKNDIVP
jgi:formylmethanofuran dehydrogenase subunit D